MSHRRFSSVFLRLSFLSGFVLRCFVLLCFEIFCSSSLFVFIFAYSFSFRSRFRFHFSVTSFVSFPAPFFFLVAATTVLTVLYVPTGKKDESSFTSLSVCGQKNRIGVLDFLLVSFFFVFMRFNRSPCFGFVFFVSLFV